MNDRKFNRLGLWTDVEFLGLALEHTYDVRSTEAADMIETVTTCLT